MWSRSKTETQTNASILSCPIVSRSGTGEYRRWWRSGQHQPRRMLVHPAASELNTQPLFRRLLWTQFHHPFAFFCFRSNTFSFADHYSLFFVFATFRSFVFGCAFAIPRLFCPPFFSPHCCAFNCPRDFFCLANFCRAHTPGPACCQCTYTYLTLTTSYTFFSN